MQKFLESGENLIFFLRLGCFETPKVICGFGYFTLNLGKICFQHDHGKMFRYEKCAWLATTEPSHGSGMQSGGTDEFQLLSRSHSPRQECAGSR